MQMVLIMPLNDGISRYIHSTLSLFGSLGDITIPYAIFLRLAVFMYTYYFELRRRSVTHHQL